MAKFEITVHRTDTYEIEVDENIINDEWIKNFESYMWDVDEDCPHEDLAKHIGQMRARFGSRQFMEGFGLMNVEGDYFTEEEKSSLEKHHPWIEELVERYGKVQDEKTAAAILRKEVADVFTRVLEDAGVFKNDENGKAALEKFMKTAGFDRL